MNGMKTVRTFGNLAEAGFASSLLEAAGIRTLMADEQSFSIGYGATMGGLRVQVDDADFERAVRVLDEGPDASATTPPEPAPEMSGRIPTGLFVAGAVVLAVLVFAVTQWRIERNRTRNAAANSTYSVDNNHGGQPDVSYFYESDRLVRMEADRNHDGRIDEWSFYDAEGRTMRAERDQNFDGKADDWYAYEKGEVVTEKQDTDFNGLVDCVVTFANGIATRVDYAPNESGIVTRREILKDGVVIEEWVDENRDGVFDYKILFDPFGEKSKPIPIEPGR